MKNLMIYIPVENITQQLILLKTLINNTNYTSTHGLKTLKNELSSLQSEVTTIYSNTNLNNNGVIHLFNELNSFVNDMNTTMQTITQGHSSGLGNLTTKVDALLTNFTSVFIDFYAHASNANIHEAHPERHFDLSGYWSEPGGKTFHLIPAPTEEWNYTSVLNDGNTYNFYQNGHELSFYGQSDDNLYFRQFSIFSNETMGTIRGEIWTKQ